MRGFTDIHSHFVYGVDDGAKTKRDMEIMLDAAYADGIVSLFATPHIIPGIQHFDAEVFSNHFNEARQYCRERGYPMALYAGAEILYTPALKHYIFEYRLPTLANSDYVLIEFVPDIALREIETALEMLEEGGYIPVLAHVERYRCLFHGRNAAKIKTRYNVRYQVNARTLLKEWGFFKMYQIRRLFQSGLVDFVASDAHDIQKRPFLMGKAYSALGRRYSQRLARHLTGLR